MTKAEMLNAMFKGTQYERNIKLHVKKSKERIEECFDYWLKQEDKKKATCFVNAVM